MEARTLGMGKHWDRHTEPHTCKQLLAIFLSRLVIAKDELVTHSLTTNPVKGQRNRWWLHDKPVKLGKDFKIWEIDNNTHTQIRTGGEVLCDSHMVFLCLSSGWLGKSSLQILWACCLYAFVSPCACLCAHVCVYSLCLIWTTTQYHQLD